jgi:hypothetical protein
MLSSELSNNEIPVDVCENCKEVYSHEFATIQEIRLVEDKDGLQITTYVNNNGDICSIQRTISNIDNRRNNCYHLLACENCSHVRSVCVYQHKGITYINNKHPLSIPDIPGLKKNMYHGKFYLCDTNWCVS